VNTAAGAIVYARFYGYIILGTGSRALDQTQVSVGLEVLPHTCSGLQSSGTRAAAGFRCSQDCLAFVTWVRGLYVEQRLV